MTPNPAIQWRLAAFNELSTAELYEIIKARIEVFVVEQNCVYQDLDDIDYASYHFTGWSDKSVAAYVRILPPCKKYEEPSIGRVITAKTFRGIGLGKELMQRALEQTRNLWPGYAVRISAQQYLEKFYEELGFKTVSAPYDEDGIPHLEMVLGPP